MITSKCFLNTKVSEIIVLTNKKVREYRKARYKIIQKNLRKKIPVDRKVEDKTFKKTIEVECENISEFTRNLFCDSNVISKALSLMRAGESKIIISSKQNNESDFNVSVVYGKKQFNILIDAWNKALIEIEDYETLCLIRDFEIPE